MSSASSLRATAKIFYKIWKKTQIRKFTFYSTSCKCYTNFKPAFDYIISWNFSLHKISKQVETLLILPKKYILKFFMPLILARRM